MQEQGGLFFAGFCVQWCSKQLNSTENCQLPSSNAVVVSNTGRAQCAAFFHWCPLPSALGQLCLVACMSQILLKEVLNWSRERQAVFYWLRVKMMKTSWVREKRGDCEEDEKNAALVPLNQCSPQALQRLWELCGEGNVALWKAESQREWE